MANEIKFYLSGGSSNTNPFQSIGGTISNTEIINGLLNNLWSDVSESDTINGLIDHRVIYVKNASGGTLTAVKAYFGELDTFTGMAILSSTSTNTTAVMLNSATDAVTDYFLIYGNAGEAPVAFMPLNNSAKRVALEVGISASPVFNQYPDKVDMLLSKTGSPTGTATVKVWAMASGIVPSATDNTVIRTLGTIDVSTLTTSFAKYSFSTVADLVQNPLPSIGWRIGIEYTSGTTGAFVSVGVSNQPNTPIKFASIGQSWDGSKWTDFANNIPSFDVYTNHGACFQSGAPPPPGSGTPPPGECLASNAAAGTQPVAGGGGGAIQHGYALTGAVDNGNDGNVAKNAIDRKTSTRWSQDSTNALLTVDMGQNHPIDHVKLAWYKSDERQAKFNLSYSTDNTTYTPITPIPAGANYISDGDHSGNQYEQFALVSSSPANALTARYVRYIGLGNTVNTWNSVTEIEVYGPDVSNLPPSSPPPPEGINYTKPSSYDTGISLPDMANNDFVAIHLERNIPVGTNHQELDNYSIIISNVTNPAPPVDEPIPPGGGNNPPGGGTPIGEIPLPTPPGVFDPGTIPPPAPIPDPPPPGTGQCPGDPNQPPDNPGDPGGGTPGGGGKGTTPDGIQLVELPAGYTYGQQYTGFHENFQSNGSFRLDVGVQPQLNELNLTFSLNLSSGSDEISSKLSGGTHTDSKAKNGRCYDIGLNQAGDRVRIRKEDPHPDYHDGPSHSISLGSLNGKWVYVQSLKWNEGSNCHLQCWVDTSGSTAPTNKFVKVLDDIDTGGWFESPYLTCYDSSDSQTTIRVDSMSTSKFHYKMLCATRIVHG